MFVDSHCHLDFPELAAQLDELLNLAAESCQRLFAAQTEALQAPLPEEAGRPRR